MGPLLKKLSKYRHFSEMRVLLMKKKEMLNHSFCRSGGHPKLITATEGRVGRISNAGMGLPPSSQYHGEPI